MILTEKKRVKVDHTCKSNPVFVSWVNTLGGREHWLFDTVQSDSLNTDLIDSFESYTTDLESSRGSVQNIEVLAQPQITLYALVDSEDVHGFKSLLYSVNVEVLMNPYSWQTDGPIWQTWRPLPGSFLILNTDEVRTEFEITLSKPEINNISQ